LPTPTPTSVQTATPTPSPSPQAGGAPAGGGTTTPPDGGSTQGQTGGAPARFEPQAFVGAVVTGVVKTVQSAVKPEAATAVAQSFGFPLALMIALFAFLIIQGRMDERDPKLRRAPLTAAETTVLFVNEADL